MSAFSQMVLTLLSDQILAGGSLYRYQEMEYFVPLEKGLQAVRAIKQMFYQNPELKLNIPVIIRNAAADEGWLSQQYKRPSLIISLCAVNSPDTLYVKKICHHHDTGVCRPSRWIIDGGHALAL